LFSRSIIVETFSYYTRAIAVAGVGTRT
jgi:hypothetical protein